MVFRRKYKTKEIKEKANKDDIEFAKRCLYIAKLKNNEWQVKRNLENGFDKSFNWKEIERDPIYFIDDGFRDGRIETYTSLSIKKKKWGQ